MPASASSWKHQRFHEGVPLPFRAVFNAKQFARLKIGLVPQAMEDKWFIYYEEPYLFFHRSWTGQPVYRLKFKLGRKGAKLVETLWSKELADVPGADVNYQVSLLHFLVSNLLLKASEPFPMPPGVTEPVTGALQHHIAGTAYAQSPTTTRKKHWWRIW
jgi:hypothetical protein